MKKNLPSAPPDKMITALLPNQIFVFGSNEAGIHGAGAARQALNFGAVYGKGIGLVGQTYALPTKDIKIRTLPLKIVKLYIDQFLEVARNNPDKEFLMTRIGCGLAGYKDTDIYPYFIDCPTNIVLPDYWVSLMKWEKENG